MERTRAPGEDKLHLSGVVEKQDTLGRQGLMFTKQEKRYRYSLQTHVHGGTHMSKYDSEHMKCIEGCT